MLSKSLVHPHFKKTKKKSEYQHIQVIVCFTTRFMFNSKIRLCLKYLGRNDFLMAWMFPFRKLNHPGAIQINRSKVGLSGFQKSRYTEERWDALDVGSSSRAWTVRPTFTRPLSSKIWWGKQSLSWKIKQHMHHIAIIWPSLGTQYILTRLEHSNTSLLLISVLYRNHPSLHLHTCFYGNFECEKVCRT